MTPDVCNTIIDGAALLMRQSLDQHESRLRPMEVGTVTSVGRGVIRIDGLPGVFQDEVLQLESGATSLTFNLDPHEIGAILLDGADTVRAGDEVRRTRRVLDIPVGEALLGRVVDPLCRPIDRLGTVHATERRVCERPAPSILDRLPVTVPLQTGIKVVDALVPVGRGQRELILGDRQTGKTSLALDTILNQSGTGVVCVYCAIGQRSTSVAEVINNLKRFDALKHTVVVVAEGDAAAGVQYVAPYAAMSVGEFFMERGQDVLVVLDDLTTHARAYRELSLLLRRPPGREAFPGDIFYLHSRLLERSTHSCERKGGGSLTCLAIAETESGDAAAYIPTNLISITDGQIVLSSELFQKGMLPAVDVGRSVSRVGGKTQLPAFRSVTGDLRLSYAQFEELEAFSRFSSRLDDETQATLERGRRVRTILKQPRHAPLGVSEQLASLLAVTTGVLDQVAPTQIVRAEAAIQAQVAMRCPKICDRICEGDKLEPAEITELKRVAMLAVKPLHEEQA